MKLSELIDICINKKRLVCIVGAGGKTTLMCTIADAAANAGKKVVVSTTTHIKRPRENYAAKLSEIKALWDMGKYAVAGTLDSDNSDKIISMKRSMYTDILQQADLILLEADGAKGHPCKVPAAYEPMIATDCDLVIGVMGMSAYKSPLRKCCFRYETEGAWLGDKDAVLDRKNAIRLLSSDKGTKKSVGDIEYIVCLNQCDTDGLLNSARKISETLVSEYKIESVCCSLGINNG